jgi:hypothetical protein
VHTIILRRENYQNAYKHLESSTTPSITVNPPLSISTPELASRQIPAPARGSIDRNSAFFSRPQITKKDTRAWPPEASETRKVQVTTRPSTPDCPTTLIPVYHPEHLVKNRIVDNRVTVNTV